MKGIPVKNTVTYLGIVIDKNDDDNEQCQSNFKPIIDQIRKKFNLWLLRDLSMNGRVLFSKAGGTNIIT